MLGRLGMHQVDPVRNDVRWAFLFRAAKIWQSVLMRWEQSMKGQPVRPPWLEETWGKIVAKAVSLRCCSRELMLGIAVFKHLNLSPQFGLEAGTVWQKPMAQAESLGRALLAVEECCRLNPTDERVRRRVERKLIAEAVLLCEGGDPVVKNRKRLPCDITRAWCDVLGISVDQMLPTMITLIEESVRKANVVLKKKPTSSKQAPLGHNQRKPYSTMRTMRTGSPPLYDANRDLGRAVFFCLGLIPPHGPFPLCLWEPRESIVVALHAAADLFHRREAAESDIAPVRQGLVAAITLLLGTTEGQQIPAEAMCRAVNTALGRVLDLPGDGIYTMDGTFEFVSDCVHQAYTASPKSPRPRTPTPPPTPSPTP